ncbi:NAD(P)/FAD-dependent oxidoreductase [Bernardetia sp.]|uniref:NAD(P)/FAD-dependent oxidoreductase n=1 Tax=Bernardetia sp. TaxID=1937974 RepID=UPI0025C0B694|nr:FAD-dependent oxidoreductase [Bernardetia sp.]
MNEKVDYLIIGQGLAGSILAHTLLEKEKKVLVLDQPSLQHCSKVAAGICNPITGRNLVRTWKSKELFSFLNHFYPKLEQKFNQKFFFNIPVYRPFQNLEQQQDWSAHEDKVNEEVIYPKHRFLGQSVNDDFGGLLIKNGGYLRTDIFLETIKNYLIDKNAYQEELFDFDKLNTENNKISYKDIEARHIIFCRGAADKVNPFFEKLPLAPAKGEILHIELENSNQELVEKLNQIILNKGCWLVPFQNKENYLKDKVGKTSTTLFRTGSNYDHKDLTLKPTEKAKQQIETKLKSVLSLDYQIKKQEVGIRPATRTRKPLIGTHNTLKQIHIFNGFGAKGSSMIPYFAHQFVEYLLNHGELEREVRIDKWFLK